MNTRVFCEHCNKYFEVDLEDARLVKKFHDERITFANNTYYFRNQECFFNLVKQLKGTSNKNKTEQNSY